MPGSSLEDRCLLSTAVAIVTNPLSRTLVAGQTATFTAAATGSPTPTVQWEMSPAGSSTFTPLTAGGKFSGVTTDKLTITGVTTALTGEQFEAVFTNGVAPTPSLTTTPATLTVIPAPSIGKLTQTGWTNNFSGFSGTMALSGGIGPYRIVSDNGLPIGLTALISGNAIRFSGTPTVALAFTGGSITIEDSVGNEASQTFSITINPMPTISHMSNNNWTEGFSAFTGAMTITGGTGPYITDGYANLPPGVTPIISGNLIMFAGAPDVAATFSNSVVTIKDASGALVGKTFVIDVEPALILGNLTQTEWTVGKAGFTGALTIGGGTGPVALQGASGLPTGLTAALNGRTIVFTGVPTAVGTFAHASVTVKDADGATVTESFSITINATPTLSTLTQTVWTGDEPGFTGTVTITGGTAPYAIASYGSLPFTPVVRGDVIYFTGMAASQTLLDGFLTVSDKAGAEVTETINDFRVNLQPTINPLTTPQWTVGEPGYNGIITINDGTGPFTIAASRGLPTGMTPIVTGTAIAFVGTPTAVRTFSGGVITLEDSGGATLTIPVSIIINPALAFTTTSLPALTAGAAYNTTLKETGGTGADTFTLTSGSLPPGLTLGSHGLISGISSANTAYTFTVTLTDIIGDQVSDTFTIAGSPAIAVGNLDTPGSSGPPLGRAGSAAMALSGGTGSFAITSVTGLPPGLAATISGASVSITGTPTTAGAYAGGSITIDSDGVNVTKTFAMTINPAPDRSGRVGTTTCLDRKYLGLHRHHRHPRAAPAPIPSKAKSGLPFTPVVSGNTILFTGSAAPGVYAGGSITVVDATGDTFTEKVAPITINIQAVISNLSVNNWTAGLPNFPGALTIIGGTGPFTIYQSMNLPPGLKPVVSGDEIRFTGTSSADGLYVNCIVTIQDATGVQKTKTFLIDLAPPVAIVNAHLPAWQSGVYYWAMLNAAGGTGGDTFNLTSGAPRPRASSSNPTRHHQRRRHGNRIIHLYHHRHRFARRNVQQNVYAVIQDTQTHTQRATGVTPWLAVEMLIPGNKPRGLLNQFSPLAV